MSTKIEFMDGFDGWIGMASYTSDGGDNTTSPWQLDDQTVIADPFSPDGESTRPSTDYQNMVDQTGGVFGGGALKLPLPYVMSMSARMSSGETLGWMPIDDYTVGVDNIEPQVPFSVTMGYYMKTVANGFNQTRSSCGTEIMAILGYGHQEQNGILAGARHYTRFSWLKKPDTTLWAGWMEAVGTDNVRVAFTGARVPDTSLMVDGAFTFESRKTSRLIIRGTWPTWVPDGTTFDLTSTIGTEDIIDISLDGEGFYYVLTDVDKIYKFNTSWVDQAATIDLSGTVTGLAAMCHLIGKAEFRVGKTKTVYEFDEAGAFIDSAVLGLPTDSLITSLCASVQVVDSFWTAYTTPVPSPPGIVGNVLPATLAKGGPPQGDSPNADPALSFPYDSVFDDGFMVWTYGGANTVTLPNSGYRTFYRGKPLSNVGFFTGDSPPSVEFNWGQTFFIEHAYRPLAGSADPVADGVGLATLRVDEVKLPAGFPDPTTTADDFIGAIQPYLGGGNFYKVAVITREAQHHIGTAIHMDDFYLQSNNQKPFVDPDDYAGKIRIHTLRPTKVSGDFAPRGTFSGLGWPETVNRTHSKNDDDAYLVGQVAGDTTTVNIAKPTVSIGGAIVAVDVKIAWCREGRALGSSEYPDDGSSDPDFEEHLLYMSSTVTGSGTVAGYQRMPSPDPTAATHSDSRPYNRQLSAGSEMLIVQNGYIVKDLNPLDGFTWEEADIQNLRVRLRVDANYPYLPWPWTTGLEV